MHKWAGRKGQQTMGKWLKKQGKLQMNFGGHIPERAHCRELIELTLNRACCKMEYGVGNRNIFFINDQLMSAKADNG